MKKGLAAIALIATGVAAHAQTVVDDFTTGMPDYVLPTMPAYGFNAVAIPGPIFNTRSANAAGYVGNGVDPFVVSAPGNGTLSATGYGTASGMLNLAYSNGGPADISGYQSFTLHVSGLTAPVNGAFGIYSGAGYSNYSYQGFTINSTGDLTLSLAGMIGNPLIKNYTDSLFFDISVGTGQSISISKLTANPVPEPASMAAMGVGLLFLARRRKKA